MKNKHAITIYLIIVLGIALFFRATHLDHPFWVDEFSTVSQANMLSSRENFKHFQFEQNNYLTHFFTFLSVSVFGQSETAARLPSVLLGSIVPILIFLLGRQLFTIDVGIISSLLATFSYFQITWSRQARGYALQQVLVIALLISYIRFITKKSLLEFSLVLFICVLGVLTHTSFIVAVGAVCFHYCFFNFSTLSKKRNLLHSLLFIFILTITSIISGQLLKVVHCVQTLFQDPVSNLNYYHSFLWREQTVVTLLASIGALGIVIKKKNKESKTLLLVILVSYLIFVSFILRPYVSRYLSPIFPLLLLLCAYSLSLISQQISQKFKFLIAIILTVFILINGDTFVIKPKAFYSVNHDMREIALLDYDKVYNLILEKSNVSDGSTAIIDTWPDRTKWYLGEPQGHYYLLTWSDPHQSNGITVKTRYTTNQDGEKYLPKTGVKPVKLINTLEDLLKVRQIYSKGFLWIDDSSLPKEIIDYAENNFNKELYVDRYSLDDNPYSIWPGTLYSWGFEE